MWQTKQFGPCYVLFSTCWGELEQAPPGCWSVPCFSACLFATGLHIHMYFRSSWTTKFSGTCSTKKAHRRHIDNKSTSCTSDPPTHLFWKTHAPSYVCHCCSRCCRGQSCSIEHTSTECHWCHSLYMHHTKQRDASHLHECQHLLRRGNMQH